MINSEKEEVVIKEVDQRCSLLTADKTVMVTYIDSEPPSLHTAQDVPTENHFSYHEGSDDESRHLHHRDILFTPGFENLDSQNFQHFGENVKELESQREEADKQWEAGRRTSMRNSGVVDTPPREKVEQEGLAKKLNFEDEKTCLPENTAEEDKIALLSRWEKQHSLNKIDQLSKEEQKYISAMPIMEPDSEEEDDDDYSIEETVSVESLHIRHLDARSVYLKMQDFESQRQERGYTQVLKMRDHIQKHDDHQDLSGKVKGKRPSSGVQEGNVNAKLQMFGGGMDLEQLQLKRRDKIRHHPGSPIKTNLFKDEFTFNSTSTFPSKEDTPTTAMNESPKDQVDAPIDGSPLHGKVKRRSSLSSRASVTTFETIREAEEDDEGENRIAKHSVTDLEGDESEENVAPLPKLQPNLSRRLSQERLRLDGLLSNQSSDLNLASKYESPQRGSHSRLITKAHCIPSPAAGPAQRQLHVSFHVIDHKESTSVAQLKHKGRSRSRPISAPPFHQKVVTNIGQELLANDVLKAESKVAALLSPPVAASSNLQLDIDLNRGSMKIWKQEVW